MILEALNRYCDILSADPENGIAPYGYSTVGISYALNISPSGDLLDLIPLFAMSNDGKREIPRSMNVPEQVKRSGTNPTPNFLWDNPAFVLGISEKADADPSYVRKRFNAFKQFNLELMQQTGGTSARALSAFYEKYDLERATAETALQPAMENLRKGGNLVFLVNGTYAHEDEALRKVWEAHHAGRKAVFGQCLVTGDKVPIARLHPSLKGIRNANSMGASLVSFNERAYESYNRTKGQGLNAPVSEKAAIGYTKALNYLLSSANPNRKIYLGDATVVYWAESNDQRYANTFAMVFDPANLPMDSKQPGTSAQKEAGERIQEVARNISQAKAIDPGKLMEGLDESTRFYVLGLAPNAARVSVRFFLNDAFTVFIDRVLQHYRDLEIEKEFPDQSLYITPRQILWETIPKAAKDKEAAPLMAGALTRAILNGSPYPAALYYAMLNRIRAENDSKTYRKINHTRAAVIKAYLLRKYRKQGRNPYEEGLTVSLNEKATQPAYLLGRLFAVLEKVQQEAIGEMNASIKDRYFTSACASPASVFPMLLRLSQHHIKAAEHGKFSERQIEEILQSLDVETNPIPSRLNLDEQGVFILGYYHQRHAFYVKKDSKVNEPTGEEK